MPLRERAGEGEGGGGGEEWSRSPSSGTDRAAVFPAGLVIEYLVVPRRNFSLPLSSHPTPRPLPFLPIPIPPPPPHLLGEFHHSPRELHVQPARRSWGGGSQRGGRCKIPGRVFFLSPSISFNLPFFPSYYLLKMTHTHTKYSQSSRFIPPGLSQILKTACFSLCSRQKNFIKVHFMPFLYILSSAHL